MKRYFPLGTQLSGIGAAITASVIAGVYACFLFGTNILLNQHGYWEIPFAPLAMVIDIRHAMSGYYWIMLDEWRWPLLWLPKADAPGGVNGVKLDPIPLLALVAKAIHSVSGVALNLVPLWLVATFALNATALSALVRAFGERSLLACIAAAGIGAMMPVVHHRFGHLALMAHWIPVFALVLYVGVVSRQRLATRDVTIAVCLCLMAATVHLYLFAMTAAIALAVVMQAVMDRRVRWVPAAVALMLIPASGLVPIWVLGGLDDPGIRKAAFGFGYFSMNLLSPIWPVSPHWTPTSGVFGWLWRYVDTGAPSGQYEGYAYLGLGALIMIVLAAVMGQQKIIPITRRYWVLLVVCIALTVWALSNQVYLGSHLVLSYPVPAVAEDTILGWFRASGRFFWPVAWLLVGLGIAGTLSRVRPHIAAVIVTLCLGMQWADLSVWRAKVAEFGAPRESIFGSRTEYAAVFQEVAARGRLTVVPSIDCIANAWKHYWSPENVAILEMQLMAARANAAWRVPTGARMMPTNCQAEQSTSLVDLAGTGVLVSLDQPAETERHGEARSAFDCRRFTFGLVCLPRA